MHGCKHHQLPTIFFPQTHILAADDLVLVVLAGKDDQVGLDDATTQAQHQVEGGLLLDVVVGQCATILQLLAGKNQTLLIRGNPVSLWCMVCGSVWDKAFDA